MKQTEKNTPDQPVSCESPLDSECQHCGQALKAGQTRFCCSGCQMVWTILKENGWDRYYDLKGAQINDPVEVSDEEYDYLETESFREKWVTPFSEGQFQAVFYIKGIQCAACVWLIEKILNQTAGIVESQLFMGSGKLKLIFDDRLSFSALGHELARLGYRLGLQEGQEAEDLKTRRRETIRLGVSGALAGNLMMFTLPLYTGGDTSEFAPMFGFITFFISIPVLVYSAKPFLVKAWLSAQRRLFHLDIPIALGVIGGEVLSAYNLFTGEYSGVYFDSIGMLVFFLLAGRYVQARSVDRAMEQCKKLMSEMPELIEVFRDEQWRRVVAEDLQSGELLRLNTGAVLPVDAALQSDVSIWNMQVVTGESLPQRIRRDQPVPAGAINMGGTIELRSTSDLVAGSLAQLEQSADRALDTEENLQNSRLAAGFTVTTLLVAATGIYLWWPHGPVEALKVALTIFVVACPCALALARPTAEAFGVLRASEMGFWVKKNRFFPKMDLITHIIFDKTGVLTHGELEIVARQDFLEDTLWLEAAVRELESHSDHPVAAVLTQAFTDQEQNTSIEAGVTEVEIMPGRGIAGLVGGHRIWIGSLDACDELFPKIVNHTFDASFSEDQNLVAVVLDGEMGLLLGLKDRVRIEVPQVISQLRQKKYHIEVLSGDRQTVVDSLVSGVEGLEGQGNMKPQDKLCIVREQDVRSPTLMVGDGLNDMGALAAARVGIAAGKAAPAALRYSDAVLQGSNLSVLIQVIELAKSVKKAIILNIAVSLGYNVTSFYLALTGVIGPLVAAVLMPLSSLSIIGISALMIKRNKTKWEF